MSINLDFARVRSAITGGLQERDLTHLKREALQSLQRIWDILELTELEKIESPKYTIVYDYDGNISISHAGGPASALTDMYENIRGWWNVTEWSAVAGDEFGVETPVEIPDDKLEAVEIFVDYQDGNFSISVFDQECNRIKYDHFVTEVREFDNVHRTE